MKNEIRHRKRKTTTTAKWSSWWLTLLAAVIKPILTDAALGYLSLVGSVLIFCVGVNLVWGKKIRVANLLPAVILAVIAAFLPLQF